MKTLTDTLLHRLQQDLSDPATRVMKIKTKINGWGLVKLKSLAQQRKP